MTPLFLLPPLLLLLLLLLFSLTDLDLLDRPVWSNIECSMSQQTLR